jgi:hypothetical protein
MRENDAPWTVEQATIFSMPWESAGEVNGIEA